MDHATLVDFDLAAGQKTIDAMAAEHGPFDLALIATFEDYYYPRVVIAAKWLDPYISWSGRRELFDVSPAYAQHRTPPTLMLMKTSDPFVQEAIRSLGPNGYKGMRLDSYSFGGRRLLDGFVYQVKQPLAA